MLQYLRDYESSGFLNDPLVIIIYKRDERLEFIFRVYSTDGAHDGNVSTRRERNMRFIILIKILFKCINRV